MTKIQINKNDLYDLYISKNHTAEYISQQYDVSKATIGRLVKKYGIVKLPYVKHFVDEMAFNIFTLESCYWAGFIAADGNLLKTSNLLKIKLKYDDKDHILKFCNFLKRDDKLFEETCDGHKQIGVFVCNKNIKNDLINNFNITPAKSFTLQPPNKIPDALIQHYIRGYFDGDGSIGIRKNGSVRLHFVSGSKNILDWIKNNIDIKTKTDHIVSVRRRSGKNFYEIEYSGKNMNNIFNWLYKDSIQETRLDRKYERYQNYLQK